MLSRVLYAAAITAGVLLGAIGVLARPTTALAGVAVGVFIGTGVALNTTEAFNGRTGRWTGRILGMTGSWREAGLRAGGVTIAAWLVITGIVMVLGPVGAIAIAIVLAAALPWLWRRLGTPLREPPTTVGRRNDPMCAIGPAVGPEQLTTLQLCVAWQHSYFALLDFPTGPAYWEVVRVRECLLDELERRDPAGFARWLETGARAGSDPGRYLTAGR